MFIFEKVWNKFKQNFHGCRNINLYILTTYLGTLFNYNLISNCCQFLMALLSEPEY